MSRRQGGNNEGRATLTRWVAGAAAFLLVLCAAPSALSQGGGGGGGGGGDHSRYIQLDDGGNTDPADDELVLVRGGGEIKRVPVAEAERSLPISVCGACHEDAVAQLKNSVHFTVQSGNPRILFPGGGAHGALDRACGLPGTSALVNYTSDVNLGECGKCHVGRFIPPMQGAFTSSFMQMGMTPEVAGANAAAIIDGGLDCLICHADHYKAVRDDVTAEDFANLNTLDIAGWAEPGQHSPTPQGYAKAARDNTDFDRDGNPDLLIDADLDGEPDYPLLQDRDGDGTPETPWPTVMQDRSLAAIQSVGKTDEHTCLRCHEHARTGYKRGTLFLSGYDVHADVCFPNPSLSADDPACPEHNSCTACHVTLDGDYDGDGLVDVHKFVRGHLVGGDLAAADYPPPPPGVAPDPADPTHLTCVQCHDPADLPLGDGVHGPGHLASIACETCHITRSGGITYSLYGHGGHLSFGRNADGFDHKLITHDHMVHYEDDPDDVDGDFAAFRLNPVLMWFDGQTSFLAQSLAIRSSPNAKIAPFKPMANGMVMDGRFFLGEQVPNQAIVPYPDGSEGPWYYNAHSMYRFFANATDCANVALPEGGPFACGDEDKLYGNAEVFAALGLIGDVVDNFGNVIVQGMTPEEVRKSTLMDFQLMDRPDKQTMAMMQVFPNLINFDKSAYGFEHYLVSSALAGTPADADGDGILDAGADAFFALGPDAPGNPVGGANAGLMAFMGFNMPMYLPSDYQWYPMFEAAPQPITMKLPDGKFMKLFLSMGIQQQLQEQLPPEQWDQIPLMIQGLVGSYPAFSNGVTLGGHGVVPEPGISALGAGGRKGGGCLQCHTEDGVLDRPVPVTKEQMVELPGMGPAMLPVYRWTYYNYRALMELGVTTENDDIVDGSASVDVGENTDYVRRSPQQLVLNWFGPTTCPDGQLQDSENPIICYLPADASAAMAGTGLTAGDITWNATADAGGEDLPAWMPVLEPVLDTAPNYAVLGYAKEEVVWSPDDPRISPNTATIESARWLPKSRVMGRLSVQGSAPGVDRVDFVNPDTGELLYRLRPEADGSFAFVRHLPITRAPCSVATVIAGLQGAAVPVSETPADCEVLPAVAER